MDLLWWQWALAALGALLTGLGKGGLPGVGNFTVILFVLAFEAKASVGLLLPILISADVVAVLVYRRHAEWRYVFRLLPWMLVGIGIGYFVFDRISSASVERLIGLVVLAMTALQIFRNWMAKRRPEGVEDRLPHSLGFSATMGVTGGFATMVANAAGPINQLYLLSVGLPKMAFIGTAAWTFFVVNLLKVPLQVDLGIINFSSMAVSLRLMPFAMIGALIAPKVVGWISQEWFTRLIWAFVLVAALKLLVF
jgi:hypothetical protein